MKTGLGRGTLNGARIGVLAGLCLGTLYAVGYLLGTTEFGKSLGFSLLLIGWPTLFVVVPALEWLGLQGGTSAGVAVLLLTLTLNGALWGAIVGAVAGLASLRRRTA